ncbi:MAG: hypothetical protein V2A77_11130 [Pseudomonadota bacterium]
MDRTTLVEKDIEAGRKAVETLDKAFEVTAALWLYSPDSEDWSLVIASPEVADKGPQETYRKIREVLTEPDLAALERDITVRKPDDDLIGLFKVALHLEGIGGVRFTRNIINGVLIEDAYVYRMQ